MIPRVCVKVNSTSFDFVLVLITVVCTVYCCNDCMVFWWKLWLPWWIFIKHSLSHYNGDTVSVKAALESHPSFLMAEFSVSVFASNHHPQYIPNYLKPPVSKQHSAQMSRTAEHDRSSNWFFIPSTHLSHSMCIYEAFSRGYAICSTKWIVYLTSIWSRSGRSDNIQRPAAIRKTNV